MPARTTVTAALGPVSESLQGRNPREVGSTVPQALWGFGRGGDGMGAWALSITAVGERIWTGCGTDSGTRQP